jgi:hypothetical protein
MTAPKISLVSILIVCLSFAAISNAESSDPVDEMKTCAKTANPDERIACYEALGKRMLEADAATTTMKAQPVQTAPIAADAAVAAQASTPELKDDLGGERFAKETDPAEAQNQGLITSCRYGRDDRWYFYFDNGQVWRQSNFGRLSVDECNFIATINKGLFGYKMKIDGRDGKIRVSRRK